MRNFVDVRDHTIDMINAIIANNLTLAGNILNSNDIRLTVKLYGKTTVEHVLTSKNFELITFLITKYKYWDFSESEISFNLINAIYDYFSQNAHHQIYLSVSSDIYGMSELSMLKQLSNLIIDIPIPGNLSKSLDAKHQDSDFEPSSPSNCDRKSLSYYEESLSESASLKHEAHNIMSEEGVVASTFNEQVNTGQMAAEEISTSPTNVGTSNFVLPDDDMIFAMDDEDQELRNGLGI